VKKKWVFLREHAISDAESEYWFVLLKKILKIGVEFEYNLPGVNGACSSDMDGGVAEVLSSECPCVMSRKYDCDSRCINEQECSTIPIRSRCEQHLSGKCSAAEYPTCPSDCSRWKLQCLKTNCVDFEAPCNHGCVYFKKDCFNCVEYTRNSKTPRKIRERAKDVFKPLKAFEKLSSSGVYDVTEDGSLLGDKGIEIITTGRRFTYQSMYNMTKDIVDFSLENGAYVNCRCGLHFHILAGWLDREALYPSKGGEEYSELEKPMPDVILANLHQLYRRFSAAIVWLTSTGDSKEHLTRWLKFRKSILPYSPITSSMYDLVQKMKTEIDSYRAEEIGKYAIVNYNWMRFDEDDKSLVKRFHIEFRGPDGNLSATATTAIAALHWALILKAAKISKWGLLEAFTVETAHLQRAIFGTLVNNINNTENRVSHTAEFFANGYDAIVIEDALQLIRLLKSELLLCGNSYEVLNSLAKKPMSIRRIEGMSWKDIERSLDTLSVRLDEHDSKVEMAIELGSVSNKSRTREDYVRALAEALDLSLPEEEINKSLGKLVSAGKIIWSEPLGAFIKQ
jgi:hypothetical protein